MSLIPKTCVACEGGLDPLSLDDARERLREVPAWRLLESDPPVIERTLELTDFRDALKWTNRIGMLAEEEGHHPNLHIESWNRLRIVLYTHAIGGLHDNDFVVAKKIDELLAK